MNLFVLLVGPTAKARKGTSWGHIYRIFREVDPKWTTECIKSGLASGEALIWHTRDAVNDAEKNAASEQVKTENLKF